MPEPRRRQAGIRVRPEAVRQARLEAGLSLAQVAGGDMSRNAIHLVEMGRSSPSARTLGIIAERTGRPVEYFLAGAPATAVETWAADQYELTEVESLLARGESKAALERGTRLLDHADPALAATIRLRLAEAHCRLCEPEDALDLLAAARPAFEARRDEWSAIEALDWEAAALFLLEDPLAVDRLDEARRRCEALSTPAPGLLARIETHLAMVHVHRHSWKRAISAFESAISHADGVVDLLELGHLHNGLGRAYQELGHPGQALAHASRALAFFELRAESRLRAVAHNNIAELLIRDGQFEAAETHVRAAVEKFSGIRFERQGLGYALCTRAALESRRGNPEAALEAALDAIEAGRASNELVVVGTGHVELAVASEMMGRHREADAAFEQALDVLSSVNQPLRLRDAHMRIAEVLDARGRVELAASHWRTAARLGQEHGAPAAHPFDTLEVAAG